MKRTIKNKYAAMHSFLEQSECLSVDIRNVSHPECGDILEEILNIQSTYPGRRIICGTGEHILNKIYGGAFISEGK